MLRLAVPRGEEIIREFTDDGVKPSPVRGNGFEDHCRALPGSDPTRRVSLFWAAIMRNTLDVCIHGNLLFAPFAVACQGSADKWLPNLFKFFRLDREVFILRTNWLTLRAATLAVRMLPPSIPLLSSRTLGAGHYLREIQPALLHWFEWRFEAEPYRQTRWTLPSSWQSLLASLACAAVSGYSPWS